MDALLTPVGRARSDSPAAIIYNPAHAADRALANGSGNEPGSAECETCSRSDT